MKYQCKICSKQFTAYRYAGQPAKYCSRVCYLKARWPIRRTLAKNCATCSKTFEVFWAHAERKKFCSRSCYAAAQRLRRGEHSTRFVGLIRYGKNGNYFARLSAEHPAADSKGYVMEHRLIMEKETGRHIRADEVVHHIDGDGHNNALENLRLMTKKAHDSFHSLERWARRKGRGKS